MARDLIAGGEEGRTDLVKGVCIIVAEVVRDAVCCGSG